MNKPTEKFEVETWRTSNPHRHCWHERERRHPQGLDKWTDCCRCDKIKKHRQA